jgi:hypothetical protein
VDARHGRARPLASKGGHLLKFWTWKFVLALAVVLGLMADAWWYGLDPYTQRPRHLLPFTERGIAPFVFPLSLLYVLSHVGGWVLAKFRGSGQAASEEQERGGGSS